MITEVRDHKGDRSLGELFGELTREISVLVRDEVALAKAEISNQVRAAGKSAGLLIVGGALAYAGLLGILAAIALAIWAAGLPGWAAALIVGGVVAGIGGVLVIAGMDAIRRVDPVPRETLRTLKEDEEWAKQQIK